MKYYFDPVIGKNSNDGSLLNPFGSFESVIASGKRFNDNDELNLFRGFHGEIRLSNLNNNKFITIQNIEQHTPIIEAIYIENCSYWRFSGLTITKSAIKTTSKLSGITIDSQNVQKSTNIIIENCQLYSTQDSTNFTQTQWKNIKCGLLLFGSRCIFKNNYLLNGASIQIGFHANDNYIGHNIIENFASDGVGNKGYRNIFEYNVVKNSYKVNGNHNDLFQFWASTGSIIKNNIFIAYDNPNQKFLFKPSLSDTQGLGLFDGWYNNINFDSNEIYVDHPIGLWLLGAKNCIINNNKVQRCGLKTWSNRLPCIKIDDKKSGAKSSNNIITNNTAEAFEINQIDGINNNNTVLKNPLPVWSYFKKQILGFATLKIVLCDIGVDLSWNNIKNANGYHIFYLEKQIGTVRKSTNFIFFGCKDLSLANYKIQAFNCKI